MAAETLHVKCLGMTLRVQDSWAAIDTAQVEVRCKNLYKYKGHSAGKSEIKAKARLSGSISLHLTV